MVIIIFTYLNWALNCSWISYYTFFIISFFFLFQCNELGNNLKDVVDKYKKYDDSSAALLKWLNSSEEEARKQQSEAIAADPQTLQTQLEETKARKTASNQGCSAQASSWYWLMTYDFCVEKLTYISNCGLFWKMLYIFHVPSRASLNLAANTRVFINFHELQNLNSCEVMNQSKGIKNSFI